MRTIKESYLEWKFREAWAQHGGSTVLVQELSVTTGEKKYRMDFVHPPTAYVIELDGLAYHSSREDQRRDRARRRDLTRFGWHFIEFTSDDINEDIVAVVNEVRHRLESADPVQTTITLEKLLAKGYKFRENNILRNSAVVDFENPEQERRAHSDHERSNSHHQGTAYYVNSTETFSPAYTTQKDSVYSTLWRRASKAKLLPKFDGKALSFFLSGFFGPLFGVLLLFFVYLSLQLVSLPISSTALSAALSVGAFIASQFVGWFLLIRLAKWLLERGKARFIYNSFLLLTLALLLWVVAPDAIASPMRVFDDVVSSIFYVIPVVSGFIGLYRYIAFWQRRQQ